jgi:hypothetical protein
MLSISRAAFARRAARLSAVAFVPVVMQLQIEPTARTVQTAVAPAEKPATSFVTDFGYVMSG